MIPLSLLALLSLAVYRGTLLVTGDRITRRPRRALREWLQHRSHHLIDTGAIGVRECSCGWLTKAVPEGKPNRYVILISHPVPSGVYLPDHPLGEAEALERIDRAADLHVAKSPDTSRLGYLIECPWCVSIYLGTVAAAVAWAWPAGWWRWPALALAASGVTGALATLAAPDDNDHED